MPNRRPHDHVGNFNFKVEIEGVSTAFVSKVDGLGGGAAFGGRAGLPGKVTLHGVAPLDRSGAERLEGWYKASQGGARAHHKVSIVKYSGGREVQRHAIECWPSEWKVSEMDGKSSNAGVSVRGWNFADKKAIIEEVELNHTGLRTK